MIILEVEFIPRFIIQKMLRLVNFKAAKELEADFIIQNIN